MAVNDTFEIIIKRTETEIQLEGKTGCAWNTLTYSHTAEAQAIDRNGMTEMTEMTEMQGAGEQSDFVFTLQTTDKGAALVGVKGTLWSRLEFTWGKQDDGRAIDPHGMIDVDVAAEVVTGGKRAKA